MRTINGDLRLFNGPQSEKEAFMAGYWISFASLFPFILFGVFGFKVWSRRFVTEDITPEMDKAANLKAAKYVLFYWLCDLFYMACFIDNLICKFIFGGLIMVIVFMNLASAFSYPKFKSNLERWGLLQDFLIGVGLSVYLIFIIPSEDVKDIVVPIVAGVYGGLITLVGVTWTIRKAENDKKEEEIKKAKPVIFVLDHRYVDYEKYQKNTKYLESNKAQGDLRRAKGDSKNKYSMPQICLKNSDYSYASLIGFIINDKCHFYDIGQVLPKDTECLMNNDFEFEFDEQIETVSLIIQDMLDNLYEFELNYEIDVNNQILIKGGLKMCYLGPKEEQQSKPESPN